MSNCSETCIFQNNGECCFACKDKIYQQGRAETIEEIIKLLAKKEDTILSDKQYYTIMELKEQTE